MPAAGSARDRLLETASELFYARGIAATGVDAVVAAAGLSKPTLYAYFASKSELVTAVLERRHAYRVTSLQTWLAARSDDPREQLLALFDWLAERYVEEGLHGCAFLNAAAEVPNRADPAREVVRRHKRWLRSYLAQLANQAGLDAPDELGSELLILMDGVSGRVVSERDASAVREVAGQARRVAALLIDAATPTSAVC
ncbi:MAG: TetR/AcrR family transcriptional regulator [Acidimicrobiales bacterium]